jgi:hypothetical protein
VHFLDQSPEAIAAARRNASLNGLTDKCSFESVNVFDWLKAQTATRPHEKLIPRWDAIILDPPSFTRNRAAVPDALRGYKEIHLRSLKLLKPAAHSPRFAVRTMSRPISFETPCCPPLTMPGASCAKWPPFPKGRTIPSSR